MGNGNGNNMVDRAAKAAQQSTILAKVTVELRQGPAGLQINVLHPGLDQTNPRHAAQILSMLTRGAAAFSDKWVPQFEPKLIQTLEKKIQVVQG